jgi:tetratricopeptide (TPR) repeat protein
MSRNLWIVILSISALFAGQGCTSSQQQQRPKARSQKIVLCPTVITASKGKVVKINDNGPKANFKKGSKAFAAGRFEHAKNHYLRILHCFPDSEYVELSKYNLALTWGKLQKFKKAVPLFVGLIKSTKDKEILRDAHFRLGANYILLKEWKKALPVYQRLSTFTNIEEVTDKLEAFGSLGLVYFRLEKHDRAQHAFLRTVRLYRRASRDEDLGPDPFASLAYHKLGQIYELMFRKKKFSANEKKMKEELEYKSVQFLKAQNYYLKAVRLLNPHWTVASLYRLGSMYKQMYDDMIQAPIPKGMSLAHRNRYKELLRGRIRNLLKKGAWILEHSLEKSRYLGMQRSKWIEKTRAKLKDIRMRLMQDLVASTSKATTSKSGKVKRSNASKPKGLKSKDTSSPKATTKQPPKKQTKRSLPPPPPLRDTP